MKTLLLFVPSVLAVAGLFWHAWRYRGRRIALTFFPAAFLFGVIRGNAIHWIAVDFQDGVMPYVFTNPVVQIFSASVQAVIGWVFAIYVSWWLAERILVRIPALRGDLMATVGLACVGMGAVAYGVEAGAAATGWWLWSIPTYNRFFTGVPAVGIVEWFAVGYEFLIPYLLAMCSPYRRRAWLHALWGMYLFHLFLHAFGDPIATWLPTQPFVVWHWVGLLAMAVLALAGVCRVRVETAAGGSEQRSPHGVMWGATGLFAAVMAVAQAGIGERPELLVSLVPLALLMLLAAPRTPLRWVLLAGAAAWGGARFGLAFLPCPVVAFLLLEARARWEGRRIFQVGVLAALAGVGAGVYLDGMAHSRRCAAYLSHLQQADLYARQGRTELAAREWEAARAADPEDVESYYQVGYAFGHQGRFRLAIDQYRKALTVEPRLFLGHFDLGYALESVGDVRGAKAAYRRSIELAPRFYQGYLSLGILYMETGSADSAAACFERATEIEPDRPDAYNNLGIVYQKQGRERDAIRVYEAVLRIDPANEHARRRLKVIRERRERRQNRGEERP